MNFAEPMKLLSIFCLIIQTVICSYFLLMLSCSLYSSLLCCVSML